MPEPVPHILSTRYLSSHECRSETNVEWSPRTMIGAETARIIPPPAAADDESAISPDVWGFHDTRFAVLPNGSVTLTGSRYALSGAELPELLPWIRRTLAIELPVNDTHEPSYPPPVSPPVENSCFTTAAQAILRAEAMSVDP